MSICTQEMDFFPSNFIIQTHAHQEDDHHQPPNSLSANILPPQDFHGVASFIGKRSMSFSTAGIQNNHEEAINGNGGDMDDLSDDDGSSQAGGGEKKRRLNMEQLKTLEKNFELGNKLEPDRKLQLARALGLQPRQIAIWFQNRRARWKTKQLEKDYDLLKRQFDAIKAENDSLQSQNHKLHAELMALKNREGTESINLNKETEGSCSNRSENSSDNIKLDMIVSRRTTPPAIDSHPNDNITSTCRPLFPFSSNIRPPAHHHVAHQLFQNSNNHNSSSRPDSFQCQKIDQQHQTVKEESFSNMFCGIDDQTGFWPWLEQQQFN